MIARFADVEQRARDLPTFEIPPRAARESLAVGSFAKVVFLIEQKPDAHGPNGERMWLKVIEVLGTGRYRGELENDPWDAPHQRGDVFDFEARHVCGIEAP